MMKAVFIDRDNVIVRDSGFVHKIKDFSLIKNAVDGLKLLKDYKLFIITNQSGVGRGYYTLKDFLKFNNYLIEQLKKHKIKIQKTYFCPHKPDDNCQCRKPKTKLLTDAKKEFKIDLKKSFVVGDKKSDIEFGKNGGCKIIFILNKNKKIKIKNYSDYVAKDLLDAAKWILRNSEKKCKK